jgi:hypothetical protein
MTRSKTIVLRKFWRAFRKDKLFLTLLIATSTVFFLLSSAPSPFHGRLDSLSILPRQDQTDPTKENCQRFQTMHMVFSTGCSPAQHWQAYVFFYHAMRVRQPGNITRITSGCTDEQKQFYARRHEEEVVQKMSNRFHIHFTPDYSDVIKQESYYYANKPFGLRHWMENVLGYPMEKSKLHDDTIIALLDPDMFLTRPLVNNFVSFPTNFPPYYDSNARHTPGLADNCTTHRKPVAQEYGFGFTFVRNLGQHMADIAGESSPAVNVSEADADHFYAPGPPYLVTARDMYKVVTLWCEFTPKIFPFYPHLLAEMYGYATAIAHLKMRHQLSFQLMVSEPLKEDEGWQFLEGTAPDKVCERENVMNIPVTIHYCQDYSVGTHFVSKFRTPRNFLSCEAPLWLTPTPKDLAVRYNQYRLDNGSMVPFEDLKQTARVAFMLCAVTKALNDAATYFKQNHCGDNANYNATYTPFPTN